jgi:hypothetical protein
MPLPHTEDLRRAFGPHFLSDTITCFDLVGAKLRTRLRNPHALRVQQQLDGSEVRE